MRFRLGALVCGFALAQLSGCAGRSSFLGGARRRVNHDLLFKPQAGHRYEVEVTYRDDIYNVVLSARQPRGAFRELPDRGSAT